MQAKECALSCFSIPIVGQIAAMGDSVAKKVEVGPIVADWTSKIREVP
jgi:hypothetical protein